MVYFISHLHAEILHVLLSEVILCAAANIFSIGAGKYSTVTSIFLLWDILWTDKVTVFQFKSTAKPSLKTVETKIFRSLKEPFQTASNDIKWNLLEA
jgi:hypothetical protein